MFIETERAIPQHCVAASHRKIYDATQRVVKISDALSCRTIAQAMNFVLRHRIVFLCDVVLAMRRRNAVLWPRPMSAENK